MPQVSEFVTASIQATLFTPGLTFVSSKILGAALKEWGDRFNSAPISIPSPPDMPLEIPRIMLQSENGQYKLELAPARANLFWFRKVETYEINMADFLDSSGTILCDYIKIVNGKAGRIAAVVNRFFKEPTPGLFLARHFCKDQWQTAPFNRPESFEIHAHKRYLLADAYNINSWVRCKTGIAGKPPHQEPIILVEQDINTIPEETEIREFSSEEIKRFFHILPEEFDSVLSLYFPVEG